MSDAAGSLLRTRWLATEWQGFRRPAEKPADLTTAEAGAGFPTNSELSIDTDGTLHLNRLPATNQPEGLAEFEQEIQARMPERHLLDILKHAEPGPVARAAIKVAARPLATPRILSRRRRCVGSIYPAPQRRQLETAMVDVINQYRPLLLAQAQGP